MSQIRLKTKTATEVRRTLSRVMNMVANKEMDNKTANTIILGCNAVLSAIRTDEQQRRINELEKILQEVTINKKERKKDGRNNHGRGRRYAVRFSPVSSEIQETREGTDAYQGEADAFGVEFGLLRCPGAVMRALMEMR